MESHPLRMRGLKPRNGFIRIICSVVASFTDAWIETMDVQQKAQPMLCRILYGCVD